MYFNSCSTLTLAFCFLCQCQALNWSYFPQKNVLCPLEPLCWTKIHPKLQCLYYILISLNISWCFNVIFVSYYAFFFPKPWFKKTDDFKEKSKFLVIWIPVVPKIVVINPLSSTIFGFFITWFLSLNIKENFSLFDFWVKFCFVLTNLFVFLAISDLSGGGGHNYHLNEKMCKITTVILILVKKSFTWKQSFLKRHFFPFNTCNVP